LSGGFYVRDLAYGGAEEAGRPGAVGTFDNIYLGELMGLNDRVGPSRNL